VLGAVLLALLDADDEQGDAGGEADAGDDAAGDGEGVAEFALGVDVVELGLEERSASLRASASFWAPMPVARPAPSMATPPTPTRVSSEPPAIRPRPSRGAFLRGSGSSATGAASVGFSMAVIACSLAAMTFSPRRISAAIWLLSRICQSGSQRGSSRKWRMSRPMRAFSMPVSRSGRDLSATPASR